MSNVLACEGSKLISSGLHPDNKYCMLHFNDIPAYCEGINISAPLHSFFDIRSFEQNMETVVNRMPPFRHECYAVAVKVQGEGRVHSGEFSNFPEQAAVFFNTPYQILSWDIKPNWEGYYIMFSPDYLARSPVLAKALAFFPFLKSEKAMPFQIPTKDIPSVLEIYRSVYREYHSSKPDKFHLIEAHVFLLLTIVRRLFQNAVFDDLSLKENNSSGLNLLSRFRTMIEISFYPDSTPQADTNFHSVAYYAAKLNVHPNHLNAVTKKVSGVSALKFIHHHLLTLAKAQLVQTEKSIKEIAYDLHFESPSSFSAFFKRKASVSPLQYRRETNRL